MLRSTSAASVSSSGALRCRLCWGEETDPDVGGSALISPCNCRGSVGYIHLHCLQHWLEVKRQQGVPRNRTVRCEVCNAKYNTAHIPAAPGHAPLLPRLWRDPYAIAAVLHSAWRAGVVISGMYYAYSIYTSISKATDPVPLAIVPPHRRSNSSSMRLAQPVAGPAQPLRHHLSLSLPVPGSTSAGGSRTGVGAGRVDSSLMATVRERFDKATMVQVYWYTALMGLMPTPPNADAFAGMAVGATVGGMVAQLVFLPMLGSRKLAALACSCRLLLRCLLRLLAAEACQARGYRLLAGLVRSVMQRLQQPRRRQPQQQF